MQYKPSSPGNDTLTHVSGHKTGEMISDLLRKLDYLVELQVFINSKIRSFVYKTCLFIYIPNLEKDTDLSNQVVHKSLQPSAVH